ncbi:MAG: hypothetical protein Q7K40_03745, partial [bacterium]|nr:hypothetical protein [bacterium]
MSRENPTPEELRGPGAIEQAQSTTPDRQEAAPSFDDLLAIAQNVEQAAQQSQTAELQEKVEVLQEKEQEARKEKTDVEQIQESYGVAGQSEYYGVKASETGDET